MASISTEPNGHRRIVFAGMDGRRRTLRLGKVQMRQAEGVKLKVQALIAARITGGLVDEETHRWVVGLNDDLYEKLAAVGLVEPRGGTRLGPFIDAYLASRVDLKRNTMLNHTYARAALVGFFGADRDMRSITPGDADSFRLSLVSKGLSENTIRGVVKKTRHFFKTAIKRELITRNPFDGIPATIKANPERFAFVTRQVAEAIIATCPDTKWRMIVALARYGGLRCPSELMQLRWKDIDWEGLRVRVPSPKTERHEGGGSRLIPLYPELFPHLMQGFTEAKPGDEFVIRHDHNFRSGNLRTQLLRIISRAGAEPWPKLFQNMRSTRETELADAGFPMHVVCKWMGNSEPVAAKHYLQLTDDHFERAAQPTADGKGGGSEKAARIPARSGADSCGLASHPSKSQKSQTPGKSEVCDSLRAESVADENRQIPPRGVEPLYAD